MRLRNNKKSFSLVELMVAVAIFTVMMAIVVAVISTARVAYFTADARIITQQDLRKASRVMIHELSESNRFKIDIPGPNEIIFQIPIRVIDGGPLNGQTVDDHNNIIFGARALPSTNPDGTQGYAIHYSLQPNNDISGSNSLIRRVLNGFPAGNQVGNDLIIANYIESIEFSHSDFPPVYDDNDSMVTICHVPPGNSANSKTITVGQAAVPAHVAHGDYLGRCVGDELQLPADPSMLVIVVSAIKQSKDGRDMRINETFDVTLRN